jgi:sulfoxide reductase heme-binding subunit YedZ
MDLASKRVFNFPGALFDFFERHFRWVVHAVGLLPLALLGLDALTNNLTVNPIQYLTLRTGKAALILLVLTLACTPINTLTGFKPVTKARRTFGLYTFLYVTLHLLIFVGLDYGFDLGLIWNAIIEKRFVLAGFAAFLIFLPLAITSFKWWMKRLGKNWKRLHNMIYVGALLAVVHYIWLVKTDIRVPLVYGLGIVLLLGLRIPAVRSRAANLRYQLSNSRR